MIEEYQYIVFILLAPLGALISLAVAWAAWRERRSAGAAALTRLTIAIAGWLIFNTLELVARTPEVTLFFGRITYVFIVIVPVLWLKFAIDYSGRRNWFTPLVYGLLFSIPAVTLLLLWTNGVHAMMWRTYGFIASGSVLAIRVLEYGAWFWIHIAYSYLMLLIGTGMIAGRYFRSLGLYRKQSGLLLMSTILPLVINLIYILKLTPFGITKDFTPLFLAFSGLAFFIGFLRYRLFDVIPVPRERVVDYMSDGVLVVDAQGRVVDINRACELILDCRGSEVIGLPVMKILPFWQKQADRKNQFNRRSVEYEPAVTEHEQLDGRHYEMRVTPFSYNRQFTDFQLIILHDITERISLLKELEQMARIDDLTGLYNRRYFLELARVEYEKVLRYGRMLSILMFDIDQFKQVNDTHGHTAGDQVLFEVSQYLSGRLRSCDLLARYGGEEFIILMPETSQQQALEAAERLRADVEDLTIQTDAGAISVTISIGAAGVAPDMSIALEKLLVQADAALYRAKEAGRNCARI